MDTTNLSKDEQKMAVLASYWNTKFKESMVAKAPYIKYWRDYLDAYSGDYFKNAELPEYKSDMVANYIFSIIETIRPIMVDNDPAFQAIPRQPEGRDGSNDLQEALSFEFERENVKIKLYRELIHTLTIGTSIFFVPWDSQSKEIKAYTINPFNFFVDPLATSVDDSEYNIYAAYKNEKILQRAFPKFKDKLKGSDVVYSELVADNNKNSRVDNQILTLEVYSKDYEREESLSNDGTMKISKLKYPKGRRLIICPELGLVLSDGEIPYEDGSFPFVVIKDYDVPGKFWGVGEVKQLISPQRYMNELNNAIIDNAKSTANMPWIIDKNAGIGVGKLTSRPGLVIRKNPGSEVKRDQAPAMPAYIINAVETYKNDMEQISGIFDSLKGNSETGVYTAQGILALQEAGQARIRLKVKLLEDGLGKMARMWVSRMKQYWPDEKWISITKFDGTYDLKKFVKDDILSNEYDVRITAGSTMPVNRGAMLDLMIRLAQTPMPDGQMLVDREAVATYLPEEVKSAMMRRMDGENQQIQQLMQQVEQLNQMLQQVAQESSKNDEQTFGVIEDITSAIESIKQQILQVQNDNDKMVEDSRKKEEISKIKETSYNEGYKDAESQKADMSFEGIEATEGLSDDMLQGLEDMSDEELQALLSSNPSMAQFIR